MELNNLYTPTQSISAKTYAGKIAGEVLQAIDNFRESRIPMDSSQEMSLYPEEDNLSEYNPEESEGEEEPWDSISLTTDSTPDYTHNIPEPIPDNLIPRTSNKIEDLVTERIPQTQWFPEWQKRTFPTPLHFQQFKEKLALAYTLENPEEKAKAIESLVPHPLPHIPVGGRLSIFHHRWEAVTGDRWVLDTVKEGVEIPWHKFPPPPQHRSQEYRVEDQYQEVMLQTTKDWVKKGVAKILPEDNGLAKPGAIYSPMFPRVQKDKIRPIVDFKWEVNPHIQDRPYHMDNATTVREVLETGQYNFAAKFDIADAFHHILHRKEDRQFLRIRCCGQTLELIAAVFGLKIIPWAFYKLSRVPVAIIRKNGIPLILYVDDGKVPGKDEDITLKQILFSVQVFQYLGYIFKPQKLMLIPKREIEFIGFMWNYLKQTISIPAVKLRKLRKQLAYLLKPKGEPK